MATFELVIIVGAVCAVAGFIVGVFVDRKHLSIR